jgi:hypothetical protein
MLVAIIKLGRLAVAVLGDESAGGRFKREIIPIWPALL